MFTATELVLVLRNPLTWVASIIFWVIWTLFSSSGRHGTSEPARHEVTINDEQKVAFTSVAYLRRLLSYVFTVIPEKAFKSVKDVAQILSTATLI